MKSKQHIIWLFSILGLVLWCFPLSLNAQGADTLGAQVFGADTVLIKVLPEINVSPQIRTDFENRRERRYYGRLLHDVKRTLPYAKMSAKLLMAVNDTLQTLNDKKAEKLYLKEVEDELFATYEPILRKMTIRQGRLLIKLIDRECQITSYAVVEIYRGRFSAFFWQGISRIFGSDLKSTYDPYGEDALVEEVVLLVEAGVI